MNWLQTPNNRKKIIITQVANNLGLPPYAVEKDWWVTLALKATFELPVGKYLVFKGGTSLSKAWQLIERFSEDIDLAIDRSFFGFEGELSKNQIDKLRKQSCQYVSTEFKNALQIKLEELGLEASDFSLRERPIVHTDTDPQIVELNYTSLFEQNSYLPQRVLIEVGARSLREPAENRVLQSLIGQNFTQSSFADTPFSVLCVNPERTFIEKVLLLHEIFLKETDNIKPNRMSRHLYDIYKMMDTDFGLKAVQNKDLFQIIVAHRKKYTPIRSIDYAFHTPQTLNIIPPQNALSTWKQDYETMANNMIYGETPSFAELLTRMNELTKRFNLMVF
jgi:predicted nucleotidyltransferase component of viral defense system